MDGYVKNINTLPVTGTAVGVSLAKQMWVILGISVGVMLMIGAIKRYWRADKTIDQ